MNTLVIFDRLDLIKRFLRAKGWERIEQSNESLLLYKGPSDDNRNPVSIALPSSTNAIDNKQMITKALNLLAVIEDRSISEVSEEIANLGSDFLRPKIISPNNAASLPLVYQMRILD